jgi:5'-phosphate synthase pdxT subunit
LVIKVGVLELQGDFALHHKVFSKLGIESIPVKVAKELDSIDGLVIPGGESTTISLLIDTFHLRQALIEFGNEKPVMGTCAGLILMAKNVHDERINPLGFLNVTVDRNAYGRQIESSTELVKYFFNSPINIELETVLIRAPKISKLGENVHVIGELNGSPVAVISGHHLGLTFHPELNGIDLFHQILFNPNSDHYYKKINQNYAA